MALEPRCDRRCGQTLFGASTWGPSKQGSFRHEDDCWNDPTPGRGRACISASHRSSRNTHCSPRWLGLHSLEVQLSLSSTIGSCQKKGSRRDCEASGSSNQCPRQASSGSVAPLDPGRLGRSEKYMVVEPRQVPAQAAQRQISSRLPKHGWLAAGVSSIEHCLVIVERERRSSIRISLGQRLHSADLLFAPSKWVLPTSNRTVWG